MLARLPFNDWKYQMGRMCRVTKNTIDRRNILIGSFTDDLAARVTVMRETWEVAA
jgi:hypothetical protein